MAAILSQPPCVNGLVLPLDTDMLYFVFLQILNWDISLWLKFQYPQHNYFFLNHSPMISLNLGMRSLCTSYWLLANAVTGGFPSQRASNAESISMPCHHQVNFLVIYVAMIYRKVSNIRRTKSQNLNVSRPVLQLSLPNLLKPCIKSRMKM